MRHENSKASLLSQLIKHRLYRVQGDLSTTPAAPVSGSPPPHPNQPDPRFLQMPQVPVTSCLGEGQGINSIFNLRCVSPLLLTQPDTPLHTSALKCICKAKQRGGFMGKCSMQSCTDVPTARHVYHRCFELTNLQANTDWS